jgi:hypothetical protein
MCDVDQSPDQHGRVLLQDPPLACFLFQRTRQPEAGW